MNPADIERTLRARAAFNESVERLDPDTCQRLRAARVAALEARPRIGSSARWTWPAGALAAALAIALFVPRLTIAPAGTPASAASPAAAASSAPMAAIASASPATTPAAGAESSDAPSLETTDPEMLADLEFYGWLAKQPGTAVPGG